MILPTVGFVLCFLLLVSIIVAFLFFSWQGLFEPEFVSAIVTSMLVLVTAVSVFLTLLLLRENQVAREREAEPVFNITLESPFAGSSSFVIENIGNGPGRNIDIVLTAHPQDCMISHIERKNIRPNDKVLEIDQPVGPPVSFDNIESVKLEGTCENIFGKEIEIYDESRVDILYRGHTDNLLRDENDRLERKLKDINKSIESVAEEMSVDGMKLFFERKNREAILDVLEEQGEITLEELSKQIGVPAYMLFTDLDRLEYTGSIEWSRNWEPDEVIKFRD